MICPKCQLGAEPMIVEDRQEDSEGTTNIYITWNCVKCDLTLDALYELVSLKEYYTQRSVDIMGPQS